MYLLTLFFLLYFQAEDGIRDQEMSRGLGDVYKRQGAKQVSFAIIATTVVLVAVFVPVSYTHLTLPTNSGV